jgi:hypothetical protein
MKFFFIAYIVILYQILGYFTITLFIKQYILMTILTKIKLKLHVITRHISIISRQHANYSLFMQFLYLSAKQLIIRNAMGVPLGGIEDGSGPVKKSLVI